MEKGYYIVGENPDLPFDINFSIKPNLAETGDVPEAQQKLQIEVEKTLVVIRKLFENSQIELRHYFTLLLTLAQAGLVPENAAQPVIAMNALQQLKMEIIDKKSGEVKNKYFKTLGMHAFNFGVGPLVFALLLKGLAYFFPSEISENLGVFANFLYLWSASMLGIWLSFGTRKTILTFEELTTIEEDRLEPAIRMVFAGSIAIVFALLFYKKAVVIELGLISTKQISSDAFISIIFGVFLGISEQVLGKKLTRKAAAVFETL